MAGGKWRAIARGLKRRRVFGADQLEASALRRCLTGWDLAALGLGSTLGVGVYVLVGHVALHLAGPSVLLSFVIAAAASLFAGLCYAEFGARVPRAGSSYIYTYVTVGEMVAFIVGWNNILESLFGTASVAKGLSMYIDSMSNNSMSEWYETATPIDAALLSPHFDLFAFLVVLLVGALLAFGVRESTAVNNVFATVNMVVILFIVIAGAFKANSSNWSIPAEEVPPNHGVGGFFPYGVWGTLRGAAICFYGFVGFDSICASGEEVKEPRRTIPIAIITVLVVVFVAYGSVATVITMMVPYYLQDTTASVATAFSFVGWEWARWMVAVGAVFGICASLIGAMFPLPRLLYAMSSDGLMFHCLSRVSSKTRIPAVATVLSASVIAILAGVLELKQLVMMMCIGTLLSYTIVAACVILLRYRSNQVSDGASSKLSQMMGCGERTPTKVTSRLVIIVILLYICTCVTSALVFRLAEQPMVPVIAISVVALVLILVIALQPRNSPDVPFTTPLVPIIPCLSIYFNVHLMIFIDIQTWIRVIIWILLGIPIYLICACCYKRDKERNFEENVKTFAHENKNGKSPIQIVVELATPPGTMNRTSNMEGDVEAEQKESNTILEMKEEVAKNEILPYETEEIVVQHAAVIENSEEKEAKIIDMLDKVLQAEEDSYGEIISLKERDEDFISTKQDEVTHRKSFSDLSDAGSDASLGNQVLSKYDVIAQVHREDLPIVTEEKVDIGEADILENNQDEEHELVTAFNESETNSRTDESGYSDTIDKTVFNDSVEDIKETPYIPTPPPLDENFFASPKFKKSYTVPKRPSRIRSVEEEERDKPRESVQSNGSQGDGNITFGSDRQINFMSKLENIFQNKIVPKSNDSDVEEQRKRSNSTGNVADNQSYSLAQDRPALFLDLKKELLSRDAKVLRPVNKEENVKPEIRVEAEDDGDQEEEVSLSKEDLKSKLESIFANGGTQLLKPRLMKSNPPTPEESYQTDTSSSESIPKLPKMEKNDTLSRQKAKFGDVLNSFRLSMNKDDIV